MHSPEEVCKSAVFMKKSKTPTCTLSFKTLHRHVWVLNKKKIPYAGPGGTPRPIELHSHDPLRYIGDMLAWLHQATASEKEHLQTLLKKCRQGSVEDHIQDVLGHVTEGVCRPLKVTHFSLFDVLCCEMYSSETCLRKVLIERSVEAIQS